MTDSRTARPDRSAVWLLWLMLCLIPSVSGGEVQRKTVTDIEGNPIVIYSLRGQPYTLLRHEEVARHKVGVRVCVEARLSDVRDDVLLLHDQSLMDVRFVLKPGTEVKAKPGANLWIGGRLQRDGGRTTFTVEAVDELASDLDLFKKSWSELAKQKNATPEDYLRIGWRLDRGRAFSGGLSEEEYDAYQAGMAQAYRKALELEQVNLQSREAAHLTSRLKRYRAFVKEFGGNDVDDRARWQLDLYRKLLHSNTRIEQTLTTEGGGTPAAEQIDRLLGDVHLMLGRMAQQYLKDDQLAAQLYRKGAAVRPDGVDLGSELKKLGFVQFQNQWVTPDEKQRLLREAREAERAEELRRARLAANEARVEAVERLKAGEGLDKIRTTVDPLLTDPKAENLRELATLLPSFSEDVQRYVLWQTQTLPPSVDVSPLLEAALISEEANVRFDAVAIIARSGRPDAVQKAVSRLRYEEGDALKRLVRVIGNVPGAAGIDGLLLILLGETSPRDARAAAAEMLSKATGQPFGSDARRWQTWWEQNRNGFRRPPRR